MNADEVLLEVFSYARFMAQSNLLQNKFIQFDLMNGRLSLQAFPNSYEIAWKNSDLQGVIHEGDGQIVMKVYKNNQEYIFRAFESENFEHVHQ